MQHPANKRHLSVLKSPENGSVPQTPVWLWVLYTCLVVISLWVPLVMAALLMGGRIGQWLAGSGAAAPSSPVLVAPTTALVLFSFGIACAAGGAVLGRFSPGARKTDAATAASVAVGVVLVFAALGRALPSVWFFLLVGACLILLGTASAVFGFRWGRRRSAVAPAAGKSVP